MEDEIRQTLILSKLDHEQEDTMYKQMESQILEVMGGGPGQAEDGITRFHKM